MNEVRDRWVGRSERASHPPGAGRCRGDRGGASSLATALLAPVFAVLSFVGFQAASWSHARTEARVVARDVAGLVARSGVGADDARRSALVTLGSTAVRDAVVEVRRDVDLVVVNVRGRAPGIVRGTSATVDVVAAVPVERWRS